MEANHSTQLSAMQNKLIAMERAQNNTFQPRPNNERWKRKSPPRDQRLPNQLESTNLVNEEDPPFYRDFENFHEESTYPVFCQVDEQGFPESSNFVGYRRRIEHINNVRKPHNLSTGHWIQMKENSEDSNKVIEEYDNATRLFGKKPTT